MDDKEETKFLMDQSLFMRMAAAQYREQGFHDIAKYWEERAKEQERKLLYEGSK